MYYLSLPALYTYEITSVCNNKCIGCGSASIKENNGHSSNWKGILDIIIPSAENIRISGGEPTLHPQFESIIQYINQKQTAFVLFTNGRWQKAKKTIKALQECDYFKGALVSLHGHQEKIHDDFVGFQGAFSETIANIERATSAGLTVATNTILTDSACGYVEEIHALASELGVECVRFARFIPLVSEKPLPKPSKT